MRTRLTLLLSAVLLVGLAAPALADNHEGEVTVVHGVPGLTVDVYVNGDLTLEDFAPDTITEPLALPEGDYDIEIYPADADAEAEDPAIAGSASLAGGDNVSIVAHLTEGGDPTLSVFANDVSETAAGEARLTVRHTAAAPAVDVRAEESPVFTGLANPDEASADLPAGTVAADVVAAGDTEPVLGPVDLTLGDGTASIVYAVGSLDDGSLDLLVQTIEGLGSAPGGVPSGTGGMTATGGLPASALAAMLLAGAAVTVSGVRLARSRA